MHLFNFPSAQIQLATIISSHNLQVLKPVYLADSYKVSVYAIYAGVGRGLARPAFQKITAFSSSGPGIAAFSSNGSGITAFSINGSGIAAGQ